MVGVFAAVIVLVLLTGISGFGLGGLPHFLLTGIVSNVFVFYVIWCKVLQEI